MLVLLITVVILMIKKYFFMQMKAPVKGKLTSKFGNRIHPITKEPSFHNGIDIASPLGTPIKAPADGIIIKQWYDDLGGNSMQIKHNSGYITGYAHLQKYGNYKVGDKVTTDTIIAYVGSTGKSTGAHLHFTLRKNGILINPETIMNFNI